MDIQKAVKLYKKNMKFGDIRELCNLTYSQMYATDYGVRNSHPEWKVKQVANKVNDDMKATEIESLFK